MEAIGKIIATEKQPSTIEEFTFWTRKDLKLKPFDVVVVEHVKDVNGEPIIGASVKVQGCKW